jgi:hypothetical protein
MLYGRIRTVFCLLLPASQAIIKLFDAFNHAPVSEFAGSTLLRLLTQAAAQERIGQQDI